MNRTADAVAIPFDSSYLDEYSSTPLLSNPKTNLFQSLAEFLRIGCTPKNKNTLPEAESVSGLKTNFDSECGFPAVDKTIDWSKDALKSLNNLYEEFSEDDYDGDGAVGVSQESFFEASKLLMMIPPSIPMPELIPEPDGGIGFEWYKDKGFIFIISVIGKNVISYAGLFGKNSETHGKEPLSDILPKPIIDSLRRLYNSYHE